MRKNHRLQSGTRILLSCLFLAIAPIANAQIGDFDGDGVLSCSDVGFLTLEISSSGNDPAFDITQDGVVDPDDLDAWLAEYRQSSGIPVGYGDVNLDGSVDVGDFNILNISKFQVGTSWCNGDFDANGQTDFIDIHMFNAGPVFSYPFVPSPSTLVQAVYDYDSGHLTIHADTTLRVVVAETPAPTDDAIYFENTTQFIDGFGTSGSFVLAQYESELGLDDFGSVVWADGADYFEVGITAQFPGDANGDGVTDGSDFNVWNENKFQAGTDFSTADFNGDGVTDGSDFNIWNENKFTDWNNPNAVVPEPSSIVLLAGVLVVLGLYGRHG